MKKLRLSLLSGLFLVGCALNPKGELPGFEDDDEANSTDDDVFVPGNNDPNLGPASPQDPANIGDDDTSDDDFPDDFSDDDTSDDDFPDDDAADDDEPVNPEPESDDPTGAGGQLSDAGPDSGANTTMFDRDGGLEAGAELTPRDAGGDAATDASDWP